MTFERNYNLSIDGNLLQIMLREINIKSTEIYHFIICLNSYKSSPKGYFICL